MILKLRASLCLLAVLTGCASTQYDAITIDSPVPMAFRAPYLSSPCPERLDAGSCVALVRAEYWYTYTGIRVRPGDSYCFHVPAGQAWFDAGRRNSPPHGEPGSFVMNLLESAKRHEDAWFTLTAAVAQKRETADFSLEPHQFASLVKTNQLDARHAGELVLYPNDAWGPTGKPGHFYENNSGQIWVQITRKVGSQACTGELTR